MKKIWESLIYLVEFWKQYRTGMEAYESARNRALFTESGKANLARIFSSKTIMVSYSTYRNA